MRPIEKSFIKKLKIEGDLLKVVGNYTELKQSMSNPHEHWGCCPFPDHKETEPSFKINTQTGKYHCFGCQKDGDIVDFIQHMEGVNFHEAIIKAAQYSKIPVDYGNESPNERIERLTKQNIENAHETATAFFQQKLEENPEIKRYLTHQRKLSEETIQHFRLGFAPETNPYELWNLIVAKHGQQTAINSGIFRKASSFNEPRQPYWMGRIIIPITNPSNNTCAFTGRLLPGKEKDINGFTGKYVNSPKTAIFEKSKILFNWNEARKFAAQFPKLIVVEGQFDTIQIFQTGYKAVVAPQGTALTEDHIKLLKSYPGTILFIFDGDQAGKKAAFKAIENSIKHDLKVEVKILPPGQDPDSTLTNLPPSLRNKVIQKLTTDTIKPILGAAQLIRELSDPTAIPNNAQIAEFLSGWIKKNKNPISAYHYILEICEAFNFHPDSIWNHYKELHMLLKTNEIPNTPNSIPTILYNILKKTNYIIQEGENIDYLTPYEKTFLNITESNIRAKNNYKLQTAQMLQNYTNMLTKYGNLLSTTEHDNIQTQIKICKKVIETTIPLAKEKNPS